MLYKLTSFCRVNVPWWSCTAISEAGVVVGWQLRPVRGLLYSRVMEIQIVLLLVAAFSLSCDADERSHHDGQESVSFLCILVPENTQTSFTYSSNKKDGCPVAYWTCVSFCNQPRHIIWLPHESHAGMSLPSTVLRVVAYSYVKRV